MCEGLLVYLDEPTITRLLTAVHRRAAPGSRLAASLTVRADGEDRTAVTVAANARRRTGTAEPWRTILTATEHRELFGQAGWLVTEPVLAPSEHALLLTADPILPADRPTAGAVGAGARPSNPRAAESAT